MSLIFLPDPMVRIGLNPVALLTEETQWNMTPAKHQQGTVLARDFITGETSNFGLVVDKPQHLKRLHPDMVDDMFKQVTQMGYQPLSMDLRIGSQRKVFLPHHVEAPALTQRIK